MILSMPVVVSASHGRIYQWLNGNGTSDAETKTLCGDRAGTGEVIPMVRSHDEVDEIPCLPGTRE